MTPEKIRIGYVVRLRSGQVGEVVSVVRGADAIALKNEVEAYLLGPQMRISLGPDWMSHYYEAQMLVDEAKLVSFLPTDLEAIVERH